MGSSSTAARPPRHAPTSRPTAPASTTTTSPRAPASRPGTSPPLPRRRGDAASPQFRTGGRWTATPTSGGSPGTTSRPVRPKGRLRTDERGLRFVEVVVNGPKTWSLAATLHPEIAAAYDAAQDRAAVEIIGWLAEHATTRVGPRGRQVQVPVEQLEAAVVRHYTSRAGDPHRHLHLQINARVFAAGAWRGLHSVGVVDSIEAINGIGHAAVMCDPEFRHALAAHGYTPRPRHRRGHPARAVRRCLQRPRRADQPEHRPLRSPVAQRAPRAGARPGAAARLGPPRLGRRPGPTRSSPRTAPSCARRWVEELHELGFTPPAGSDGGREARYGDRQGQPGRGGRPRPVPARCPPVELERRRHPRRGRARSSPRVDIVAPTPVRRELAEDLTARTVDAVRAAPGPRRRPRTRPRAHLTAGARRRGRPRHPTRRTSRARRRP